MREFIAKHQKSGLKITFKYNLNGVLQVLEFDGSWKEESVEKMKTRFPASTEKMLHEVKHQRLDTPWIFAESTEVSFEAFWKKYPKRVMKAEALKAWNKLSDVDKMEAILFIPGLVKIKMDGTAFPYPATYLNKKMWR